MYKQPFKLFIEKWIDFLQGHFSCFHLGCSKLILCLTSPCKYKIYLGVEKLKGKKLKQVILINLHQYKYRYSKCSSYMKNNCFNYDLSC